MSKPPLKRTSTGQQPSRTTALWLKRATLGLGVAVSFALLPGNALALALGKLNTLSHMGERLNAEIDILDVAASDLQGLRATVGSPDVFQASGIEFNPGLLGTEVNLQKRADGRYYFKVSTPNAINDPFINLVIVVNWPSGRIVRDYSLLLDPPDANKLNPTVVTAPVIASNTNSNNVVAAPVQAQVQSQATAVEKEVSALSKAGTGKKKPIKYSPEEGDTTPDRIKVQAGMTASEIGAANRLSGLSLDQMLVALLKGNPQAFIDGNVNRMRTGAVLALPKSQDASSTSKADAKQMIAAQSYDFEQYKRKLAGLAPLNEAVAAKRQSSGLVESKVTEKKADANTPDKLLLSNAAKDAKSKEAAIAKQLQAKEDAARLATLSKNIKDLNKLGAAAGSSTATNPSASASSSVKSATPEVAVGATASPAASAMVAQTASASASASASAAESVATPRKPASAVAPIAVPPTEEPGLLDSLSDNPLLLPAGAALIAILGGWAWYRQRQRKKDESGDSAFFESRQQTDSFFGVSGGQQIDTQDSPASSGSSYTPSQLNAAADVDPIAEADVYLAYGRDMQAEEILKDAMTAHPNRLAIPLKLLEMYAKRGDSKAFDKLSAKVKLQTNAQGPEWERARELGKAFASAKPAEAPVAPPPVSVEVPTTTAQSSQKNSIPTLNEPAVPMFTGDGAKSISYEMDLDFSTGVGSASSFTKGSVPSASVAHGSAINMAVPRTESKSMGSPDIIDFDLSALSLDLKSAVPAQTASTASPSDPWATKLALAKEFHSIGDLDSAQKMIQEVIVGAGESVKAEAKKVLATMV